MRLLPEDLGMWLNYTPILRKKEAGEGDVGVEGRTWDEICDNTCEDDKYESNGVFIERK